MSIRSQWFRLCQQEDDYRPRRAGRHWTALEDEYLIQSFTVDSESLRSIARHCRRSHTAVASRLCEFRILRGYPQWGLYHIIGSSSVIWFSALRPEWKGPITRKDKRF